MGTISEPLGPEGEEGFVIVPITDVPQEEALVQLVLRSKAGISEHTSISKSPPEQGTVDT